MSYEIDLKQKPDVLIFGLFNYHNNNIYDNKEVSFKDPAPSNNPMFPDRVTVESLVPIDGVEVPRATVHYTRIDINRLFSVCKLELLDKWLTPTIDIEKIQAAMLYRYGIDISVGFSVHRQMKATGGYMLTAAASNLAYKGSVEILVVPSLSETRVKVKALDGLKFSPHDVGVVTEAWSTGMRTAPNTYIQATHKGCDWQFDNGDRTTEQDTWPEGINFSGRIYHKNKTFAPDYGFRNAMGRPKLGISPVDNEPVGCLYHMQGYQSSKRTNFFGEATCTGSSSGSTHVRPMLPNVAGKCIVVGSWRNGSKELMVVSGAGVYGQKRDVLRNITTTKYHQPAFLGFDSKMFTASSRADLSTGSIYKVPSDWGVTVNTKSSPIHHMNINMTRPVYCKAIDKDNHIFVNDLGQAVLVNTYTKKQKQLSIPEELVERLRNAKQIDGTSNGLYLTENVDNVYVLNYYDLKHIKK